LVEIEGVAIIKPVQENHLKTNSYSKYIVGICEYVSYIDKLFLKESLNWQYELADVIRKLAISQQFGGNRNRIARTPSEIFRSATNFFSIKLVVDM
jgi:hypothetical protein